MKYEDAAAFFKVGLIGTVFWTVTPKFPRIGPKRPCGPFTAFRAACETATCLGQATIREWRPRPPRLQRHTKRKPKSLFHFLTWRGGLRPDPDVLYLLDRRHRFLVCKSGMSLDAAREACIEEGFLQDNERSEPSINVLLDLIAAEAAGRKQ
jgi:hypothetical protein